MTWHQAECALNKQGVEGDFLIRDSESSLSDFSVSLTASGKNKHCKVQLVDNVYCIGQRSFHTKDGLVEHYKKGPIFTQRARGEALRRQGPAVTAPRPHARLLVALPPGPAAEAPPVGTAPTASQRVSFYAQVAWSVCLPFAIQASPTLEHTRPASFRGGEEQGEFTLFLFHWKRQLCIQLVPAHGIPHDKDTGNL
ncbi:hypothetical protein P7K49_023623 [Saguinus oedipus]|uniref:SH2 domain-containing protein n=1 Tax=Saguinus oedipus TaxID=9490 RepID=A0ABQ9UM67_SAGOE|nr:hypothetical protein P7K49_023623 [Saguinus oedipus]